MNDSPYIFDVTSETFDAQVVDASHQVPILLDFWAEWCGPCQMQFPMLQKLIDEFDGKFRLAKLDTDKQKDLTREHNIRSIPTMKLYFQGAVVEEILGAQTESDLREILGRYMQRESDSGHQAALSLWNQGEHEQALSALHELIESNPDNHAAALDYARLCISTGKLNESRETLTGLPSEVKDSDAAQALLALLEIAETVKDTPSPEELSQRLKTDEADSEARYLLAVHSAYNGDFEGALEQLLDLLGRDRNFRDNAPRKAMLKIFAIHGDSGELVTRYRKRMFNLLH